MRSQGRLATAITTTGITGSIRDTTERTWRRPEHTANCMSTTDGLFQRYYYSDSTFRDGTTEFHSVCAAAMAPDAAILEIGAGPSNPTSDFLAGLGSVTGLDVSEEVRTNRALTKALMYDGTEFALPPNSYDACVSNY